jgi:hypothetical protein
MAELFAVNVFSNPGKRLIQRFLQQSSTPRAELVLTSNGRHSLPTHCSDLTNRDVAAVTKVIVLCIEQSGIGLSAVIVAK